MPHTIHIFNQSVLQKLHLDRLRQALTPESSRQWLPLAIALVIAALLRLYQISTESLWTDELNSYEDARDLASGNLGVRPLYYLLLRVWMVVGDGDGWLRCLAVLFDLGAIAIAYALAHYLLGRRVAVLTAVLMALSPLMINHAQEVRMYPLITFFTLSGTLALAHALERPTGKVIAAWAIARLLALFTSPLMVIMFLPDCLLYGLRHWGNWRHLRRFGYGLIFVGAAWAPLILVNLFTATGEYVAEHAGQYQSFSVPLSKIMAELTMFTVISPLVGLDLLSNPLPELFYKGFTLLLVGVLAWALIKAKPSPQNPVFLLAVWALLPAVVQFSGSELFMSGTLFRSRYFLYVVPYLMMLLAYGFEQIRHWQPKLAGGLAVLYLVAVAGGLTQHYTQLYRNDWRGVAQAIAAAEQPGDAIVNFTLLADYNFPRYYDGQLPVASIHIPRSQSACSIVEPAATEPGMEPCLAARSALVASTLDELPQAERLWLVCYVNCQESEDYDRITTAVLGANAQEAAVERFDALGNIDFYAVELHLLTAN
ncbi:MAG TPA: glycosyltransferase family 39 protein [Candidatus Obscuribacterales bacterium]